MKSSQLFLVGGVGLFAVAILAIWPQAGCFPAPADQVVVYSALDREFAEPILNDFEQATGIKVLAKYDVESTKTVGLVNAIIQEQRRPRCDVFWNNEILHSLRLQRLNLLDPCQPAAAADFPPQYRAADGSWHGFAARLRVLIVNTDLVPPDQRPTSIRDLIDEKWKGRVGIAKPLFGTTATHAAVLFQHWGQAEAESFFRKVKDNAAVLSGNKQVAQEVAAGKLAFGLTDTDDAVIERDKGMPVEIIFPDQGDGGMGALFIPNTVAVIRDAPHPDAARRLVDYLLSPEVETKLAAGESAQFPLNSRVKKRSRAVGDQAEVRHFDADFTAAAEQWDSAAEFLRKLFQE